MRGSNIAAALALSFVTASSHVFADPAKNDDVLRRALTDELTRSIRQLAIPGEAKPHFVQYTVLDAEYYMATATHGAVILESASPARTLLASVRVGTPELDNSMAGFAGGFGMGGFSLGPLEDDYAALRRSLWLSSDQEYKQGLASLAEKKNALSVRVNEQADAYPDFAAEPKHETVVPSKPVDVPRENQALRAVAERLSALIAETPELLHSGASAYRTSVRRRLLNSDQTWADETHHFASVAISASIQASDGMVLDTALEFTGTDSATLPTLASMEAKTREAIAKLVAASNAPIADSGTAVILFEGAAAAQLVQSLLASRLAGTPPIRYLGADTDRSLASKLGLEVISPTLDVFDDPTLKTGPGGEPLWGNYSADDEGVPARKVSLIERGILKTLLMSRAPRKEIRQSNGHFRLGSGASIGNLVVKTSKPLSRARLIDLAGRAAKKEGPGTKVYVVKRLAPRYGFPGHRLMSPYLMEATGAVFAEHGMLAAEAYVLSDGKEQPVRGLTIERVDLRALKDLLGAGDKPYVQNDGQLSRTSIIVPSLLLSDVDVKRHEAENPKPPSYPAPSPK